MQVAAMSGIESLEAVTQSRLRGGLTTADEAFHADLTARRMAAP